jgi:hypothetical protein
MTFLHRRFQSIPLDCLRLHLPFTRFPQNISKLRDTSGGHYSHRASATPLILTPVLRTDKENIECARVSRHKLTHSERDVC